MSTRRFEDLPGPRGVPFFGNLLQIDTERMHHQLERWSAEYGPCYRLRLGERRAVVFGDHEDVLAILRDRPDGFRRTTRLQEVWTELGLPIGVFSAQGEEWRKQRRMVMAAFDPGHVKAYFPSLVAGAERLAARWQRAAASGSAIDVQADLMRYTVDTIAGLAFGTPVNTIDADDDVIQNHLNRIFPAVFRRVFAPLSTWRYFPSRADRALTHSVAEVSRAVDRFIAEARQRRREDPSLRAHPRNLLEAMLAAEEGGLDNRVIAGNVLTMLLGGEDTTANTLAWMIHLLWRRPAALAKAIEEVRALGPAAPGVEQLGRLDYLDACISETMRLKPIAPMIPLEALRETSIGGVRIVPGMIVFCLMRRDSAREPHVAHPADFEPERWLGDGASGMKGVTMPFGAGPRICPGRYLALMEMKVVMWMLLSRFDILSVDTPDGREARELLQFTMMPVGLSMRLAVRELAHES